jgi:predicted phosphodiesterase
VTKKNNMTRLVLISDTHTLHGSMTHPIPKGDILIHAGDNSSRGTEKEVSDFIYWFMNIKGFDTKIFIAGNHDFAFEKKPDWLLHLINDENLSQSDCVYLEDEEFIINDSESSRSIKIYGSPWQPRFYDWAFNVDRDKIHVYWEKIPNDCDILLTHGPAYDIVDKITPSGVPLGCINRVNPKIHICGHIHGGRNVVEKNGTIFVNASICDERYRPINKPIVIDYDFQTNIWEMVDM